MKRLPFFLLLIVSLAAALFPGCAKEETPAVPLSYYDGTWVDAEGDILFIDSQNQSYTLRRTNGRVGNAGYSASGSKIFIYFNGFLNEIVETEPGKFYLVQNGRSADDDAESLDGIIFTRDDSVSVGEFTLSDVDGVWASDEGTLLTIDTSAMEYTYNSESGAGTGTVNNEDNGMGWYLFADDKAYLIPAQDGTLSFQTEDPDLAGTFVRQD